jgi:HAD superfamily hydrolase (TIGR01490 family)
VLLDIDGTLVRASLEQWFLSYLLRTRRIRVGGLLANAAMLWFDLPPLWYRMKLAYLRGVSERAVREWAQECWEQQIRGRLIHSTVEVVWWLQSIGASVALLSGTPRPLAEPLARHLGISSLLCAEPELENGMYTGRLVRPHPRGRHKVAAATTWLQQSGYGWDQVVAMGDHWRDRHLLHRARYAIAVNPGRRLRRHATARGWLVVYETTDPRALISQMEEKWSLV